MRTVTRYVPAIMFENGYIRELNGLARLEDAEMMIRDHKRYTYYDNIEEYIIYRRVVQQEVVKVVEG